MSIGTRYRSDRLSQDGYDVIIIGSGPGGLTAGALLAREGKRVLVLERHYTAGGFTHTFKRKRFEWDIGLHYVGEVHRKNSVLRKIFDDITEKRLRWEDMGEVYDRAIFPDQSYDFVAGQDAFIEKMAGYFPFELKAIRDYIGLIREVSTATREFYGNKALPPLASAVTNFFSDKKFQKLSEKSCLSVLKSLTGNQKLIGVLTTQWGDYGLPPAQASFAIHAMVAKHYLAGAAYPSGGASRIAREIIPVIEAAGGMVCVRAEVSRVILQQNKATGVEMKNGDIIEAPVIVSNTGVFNTFDKLLSGQKPEYQRLAKSLSPLLSQVEPSLPHVCLYLGLNKDDQSLKIPRTNHWIFPSYDHDQTFQTYCQNPGVDADNFPVVYVSFPSAKDPEWASQYPGRSTVEIITFVPYREFSRWEGNRWYQRGEGYQEFKDRISDKLIDIANRHSPFIRENIEFRELSTPLSTRHFCNYHQGQIYGLSHNPHRFSQKWLRPHTPVKNLFLTGQDIVTCGLGGAAFAGVLSASAILKKNLVKDILRRNG